MATPVPPVLQIAPIGAGGVVAVAQQELLAHEIEGVRGPGLVSCDRQSVLGVQLGPVWVGGVLVGHGVQGAITLMLWSSPTLGDGEGARPGSRQRLRAARCSAWPEGGQVMSRLSPSEGWQSRVSTALVIVLAVAVVGRVVWYVLAPLVPIVTSALFIFGIAMLLFRRRS